MKKLILPLLMVVIAITSFAVIYVKSPEGLLALGGDLDQPKLLELIPYTFTGEIFDSPVTAFCQKDPHIIYVGLESGKVYEINILKRTVTEKYDLNNKITSIKCKDSNIYISTYSGGIDAFKISKNKLVKVYHITTIGESLDFEFRGDYLYVAEGIKGLSIFKKMNNGVYRFLRRIKTGGEVSKIKIYNELMFTLDGAKGVSVYDISIGPLPVYLNKINDVAKFIIDPGGRSSGLFYDGKYLYVTDAWNGLVVYEINKIFERRKYKDTKKNVVIKPKASHPTINGAKDIKPVKEGVAYVADGWGGLNVFKIEDKDIKTLKILNKHTSLKGLWVEGDYLFAADKKDGLIIFDIKDPFNPKEIAQKSTLKIQLLPIRLKKVLSDAVAVKVFNDYAFVADKQNGLTIFDVAMKKHPVLLSNYLDTEYGGKKIIGYTNNMDILDDTHVVVADSYKDVLLIDVSSKVSPKILDIYRLNGNTTDVKVKDYYIFATTSDIGFEILEVKNNKLRKVSHKRITGYARSLDIFENYAYISAGYAGLHVLDIEDVNNPKLIGTVFVGNEVIKFRVFGKLAFAAFGEEGFGIFSMENPKSPIQLCRVDTPGVVYDGVIKNKILYVADGDDGLLIFDISNPEKPVLKKKLLWGTYSGF